MISPKKSYDMRKRVINTRDNLYDILDLGFFLKFSPNINSIYKLNDALHALEIDASDSKRFCTCDHVHYINEENSYIYNLPIINNDEDINIYINRLINSIQEYSKTTDYFILNKYYDIGNNLINFGCPICGKSFTILPDKIENLDEMQFYSGIENGRYFSLYNKKHIYPIMTVLFDLIMYKNKISNIKMIEITYDNISIFGNNNYAEFLYKYKEQISYYFNESDIWDKLNQINNNIIGENLRLEDLLYEEG